MHGGTFTGNASRTLLRNVDALQRICPISCTPYIAAFRSFNEVVEKCYGSNLAPDYLKKLRNFQQYCLDLQLNVTPKMPSCIMLENSAMQ